MTDKEEIERLKQANQVLLDMTTPDSLYINLKMGGLTATCILSALRAAPRMPEGQDDHQHNDRIDAMIQELEQGLVKLNQKDQATKGH